MTSNQPFRGSASEHSRQQLRSPRFRRVARDVYVMADRAVDLRDRVRAAQLVVDDGVPCLATAALLQRLPADDGGVVHLARGRRGVVSTRPGIEVHRLVVTDDELMDVDGLLVTDGPRTLADLSAHLDLEELVALGDVVVRRWGRADVERALHRAAGRPGVARLRQAVPLLDPGSDSPAETRQRLRLHAAGFVGMRHGVAITDEDGNWLVSPDLADEVAKVALQHQGAVHFQKGERQRRKDVDRDELARRRDWEVVVTTSRDDAQPARMIECGTASYLRQARLLGRDILPRHLR